MRRRTSLALARPRTTLIVILALGAALLCARQWQPSAYAETDPAPARSPVTVSLTYDDGTADQAEAAEIMARYGVHGTFYLNSSLLGASGRLSVSQARALQSAGNEIGGHSVTHADLPTLSEDEQARQICGDRSTLLEQGFQVSSFAYPYGDDSPATQRIVDECGYNSARVVGGLSSPGSCHGCPTAERIPPKHRYSIATPDSVKPSTSLEDMQNYVLQAEENGGGWVPIVMHRVCNSCDPYAVDPTELDRFLAWLASREPDGTVVKTVGEVIGGPLRAAVPAPPPQPHNDLRQLVRNASMESDTSSDGIPDCWQRAGYGDNTASWSNAANAHTGAIAMQVTIDSFSNGDRRIITPQDLGSCSPKINPGHGYKVTGWYRTTGSSRPIAYYRDTSNRWIFLGQAALLPTGAEWRKFEWVTPVLPSDARALSVGVSLRSAGQLAADDFAVQDTDEIVPQVNLTSPSDGSRARGSVTFRATASDASGVDHVDFLVDGQQVCTVTAAPFTCSFDTTAHPDTVIAVTARATDTAGNTGLSLGRNYTVSNSVAPDAVPPTVAMTAPAADANVDGIVTLSATASDDDSVLRVLFYVDDELIGGPRTAPYTAEWDTRTHAEGSARIQAKVLDTSGNVGESPVQTVTVGNYLLDTTPPATTASCGSQRCEETWFNTPVPLTLAAADAGSGLDQIRYTTDGTAPAQETGIRYAEPVTVPATTTVKYRAWDKAGNAEPVRTLTLKVDRVTPTVSITSPVNGATVSGTTYYRTDVSDDNSVARVLFYVDNVFIGSRTKSPYQWVWDTSAVSPGQHTLYVLARDAAGNQTRSETMTITIS